MSLGLDFNFFVTISISLGCSLFMSLFMLKLDHVRLMCGSINIHVILANVALLCSFMSSAC